MKRGESEPVVKLQFENQKQYTITLPKKVIEAIGWARGLNLKIELDKEHNIVLKKS